MQRRDAIISFASILVILASWGSIAFLDRPKSSTSKNTHPRPSRTVRVALLNGCGRAGLATRFADLLRARGYDVVNGQGGNADTFDYAVSVVVARTMSRQMAESVASDIGISRVLVQPSANPYLLEEVAIIIGRDWDTLRIIQEDTHE